MKNLKELALFLGCISIATYSLAQNNSKVIDGVVAVVGSKMITLSDIENQYLQYRAQGNIRGGEKETKCAILESSLYNKLLLNQADIDSVEVTDKQVESELDRRIRYFIQQIGSKEKLEDYFKKSLAQIKDEFRDIIRDQMRVEMVQNNLTKDIKVTPSEVRSFFRSMPEDSIPMVNAEFVIGQIVKKPKTSLADEIEVKEKLRALRKRILDGESFATLAILYSEDPGSAAKGGEVGLFGRGELYPEYEAVAFKLKEGEISDIVQTKAGFHIIQLIERRGDYINTRHILMSPKISPEELQRSAQFLDSVAGLVKNGKMSFEEAVAKFSDDPNKMNGGLMINPYTGTTRFEPDQLDAKVYYVIDKLEIGQISGPVPFKTDEGKDAYRLLFLKERSRPHKANLKDDYDKIQNWALESKKEKTLQKWVTERIGKTYIRISPEYLSCKFRHNWLGSKNN
ncbi:MAG: peptidylprolyl isomerase [Bacteroidales bacterium]